MREFGLVLLGCVAFGLFFAGVIYPDMEVKGYSRIHSCYGECYDEYIKVNGTFTEELEMKKLAASADDFSSIKGLCAACHGDKGQGIASFPKLSGQSADYITTALNQYKNNETRGAQSVIMWGQAGNLSNQDIQTLSKYIEQL